MNYRSYRELAPLLGDVDHSNATLYLNCEDCEIRYGLNLDIIDGTVDEYGEYVFYLCRDCSKARGLWSRE